MVIVVASDKQVTNRPAIGAVMAGLAAINTGIERWGSIASNYYARELGRVREIAELKQREQAGMQALQTLANRAENDRLVHTALFVLLAANFTLEWRTDKDHIERFPARGIVFGAMAVLCLFDRTPAEEALRDYQQEKRFRNRR